MQSHSNINTFLLAAESGNFDIVNNTYQGITESNHLDRALYLAAKNGHAEIVKLLLKNGRANPNALLSAPLRTACREGHVDVVKLLLEDGRVDPTAMNNQAVQFASANGHVDILRLLFFDKRDNKADFTANDIYALKIACANGNTNVVKFLTSLKCIRTYCKINPRAYVEVIQLALANDHEDIAKLTLVCGTIGGHGNALQAACEKGFINIAKFLIEFGNTDATDFIQGILKATRNKHEDVIKLLLDKIIQYNYNKEYFQLELEAVCQIAFENGLTNIAQLLMKFNYDYPGPALLSAAMTGNGEIVKLLLKDSRLNTKIGQNYIINAFEAAKQKISKETCTIGHKDAFAKLYSHLYFKDFSLFMIFGKAVTFARAERTLRPQKTMRF